MTFLPRPGRWRVLLGGIGSLLVLGILPAFATGPTTRIAVIWTSRSNGYARLYSEPDKAFFDELSRYGLAEKNGVVVERRSLDERAHDGMAVVRDVLAKKPDLVLALGTEAASDVAAVSPADGSGVPTVFAMTPEIPAPERPNITGVTLLIPAGEQFESLHSLVPSAKRIGALYNPELPFSRAVVDDARKAAADRGMTLVAETASSGSAGLQKLDSMSHQIDALWMIADPVSADPGVVDWCWKHDMPLVGVSGAYVSAGALLSLFPDYTDIGRQAADIALKILRGARPSSLAPRPPRRALLYVNLGTARKLGISISNAIRDTADRLIDPGGS